jgi:octaprenyl-diphosphate synthase
MEQSSVPSTFLEGATELFLSPRQKTVAADSLRTQAKEAFDEVHGGLSLVEEKIKSCFVSEAEILATIADYLLELGGKRIRPILALLTARLFGLTSPTPPLVDVSAGIELIHMATLLHDDIIDESPKRRHKDSAYFKFGVAPSLLAGDFLWVRAFGLCAHLGELVVRRTEEACVELTEGEILEGSLSPDRVLLFEEYERIVSKKTGSLFALAALVGAHYGGASTDEIEIAAHFGRMAGIAFQMIDDVLDVVADETLLGKPSGTDLKQQTPSLVNVLWLESGDERAREFFSETHPSPELVRAALAHLRSSAVIHEARGYASGYAGQAKAALNRLSKERTEARIRRHLEGLLDYTLVRCL